MNSNESDDEKPPVEEADESPSPTGGVCRPGVGANGSGGGTRELSEREGAAPTARAAEQSGGGDGILDRLEAIEETNPAERLDDEVVTSEADPFAGPERVETKLRWSGPGKIVYEPTLYQVGPEQYVVEARRENRGLVPWGFWGGLLFAGVAVTVLAGAQTIYSLWDILWALIGLTVGAMMYRYGRKSSFEEVTLFEMDRRREALHWPGGAQSGLEETYLSVDDITEVVFGMTRLPVDESSTDVRVDAFALLVRTTDNELLPVIEGSPYKGDVHEIAKFLAEATETELTYVGRGIR